MLLSEYIKKLQEIEEKYKERDLEVVYFPDNDDNYFSLVTDNPTVGRRKEFTYRFIWDEKDPNLVSIN
jgi:hypothetical protein